MSTPRRPRPAVSGSDEARGQLLARFLRLYDVDASFGRSLLRLYRAYCYGHEPHLIACDDLSDVEVATWLDDFTGEPDDAGRAVWAGRLLPAVRRLSVRAGLDRLPEGERLIYTWLQQRARTVISDPPTQLEQYHHGTDSPPRRRVWPPSAFSSGFAWAGSRQPVNSRRTLIVEWEPHWQGETQLAARRRLHAEVDRLLGEIGDEYEQRGYTFPDTRPRETRHLEWLYLRIRHRMSDEEIADAASPSAPEAVEPDAVRKALDRLTKELRLQVLAADS